jgi:signal transduction histidine kinase
MAGSPAPLTAVALPALRLALAALAVAGLACGLVFLALVLGSDHVDDRGSAAVLGLLVGWSFIGTGLFAWWRRPGNRTGALMAAVGFAWFATGVSASDDDLVYTVGIALDSLFPGIFVQLLLAFPTGRLQSAAERAVVVALYVVLVVLQIPSLLFEERGVGDPRNLLVIEPDQALSDQLDALQFVAALGVVGVALVLLLRRWRRATPAQRRALAPVAWTGSAAFLVFAVANAFDAAGATQESLERLALAMLAAVPFAFLAGLLRTRLAHGTAVSDLIARLGRSADADALRAALADALGDPSLAVAYWLPESERYVDAQGRPFARAAGAWTDVELHGRRIAALVHDDALADEPQLVRAAGSAAALALENQRLSAELRARIEELRASRARLVDAGDAERRRLERNLHDGAQARLVALGLKLRLARRAVDDGSRAAALLDESAAELKESLDELRELARGIHPAVLTDRGLDAALRSLAARAPVSVDVAGDVPADLPAAVETAIYFAVAEALTNVAKYAQASAATVTVARTGGRVVAEVADDGRGGADAARGSGLRGLADRVAALDGKLTLSSPPGAGTRVRVEIPCQEVQPPLS